MLIWIIWSVYLTTLKLMLSRTQRNLQTSANVCISHEFMDKNAPHVLQFMYKDFQDFKNLYLGALCNQIQ